MHTRPTTPHTNKLSTLLKACHCETGFSRSRQSKIPKSIGAYYHDYNIQQEFNNPDLIQ